VTLGLGTQMELDALVKKAAEKKAKDDKKKGIPHEGETLKPAAETTVFDVAESDSVEEFQVGDSDEPVDEGYEA